VTKIFAAPKLTPVSVSVVPPAAGPRKIEKVAPVSVGGDTLELDATVKTMGRSYEKTAGVMPVTGSAGGRPFDALKMVDVTVTATERRAPDPSGSMH
jgi:hypothetical protein